MFRKQIHPAVLQRIILLLLLMTSPYAMSFLPYEGIYADGVWKAPFHLDPLYYMRASLIWGGLLAGLICLILLFWELGNASNLILQPSLVREVILDTSVTLCSLTIGWAAFPYWVNGMFQAFSGNPRVLEKTDILNFDPFALMPAVWLGSIWSFAVYIIILLDIIVVPIFFLLTLFVSIKTKTWKQGIATILCLSISLAVFYLSPNYLNWFGD
jgi:hypothetical protein